MLTRKSPSCESTASSPMRSKTYSQNGIMLTILTVTLLKAAAATPPAVSMTRYTRLEVASNSVVKDKLGSARTRWSSMILLINNKAF